MAKPQYYILVWLILHPTAGTNSNEYAALWNGALYSMLIRDRLV